MIICPVCEHPQPEGAECEVCGKRLASGPSQADLAIPPVDGLEPTLHARGEAPAAAGGGRMPELEPTQHGAVTHVEDAMPGIEATRAAPVDVDAEPTPDLERTAVEIPGDGPTPLPALLACRYCRTPAMPGERICASCGMRLPVLAPSAAEAAPAGRLCSCGTVVRGSLCPTCGARMG
jgi:hypothetical protein